jgi:hypothetical protein
MSAPTKTPWKLVGVSLGVCNCDWSCQFNLPPTHPTCETFGAYRITSGHFGATDMAGVVYAVVFYFPGPVHEGNGTARLIIDERASPEQRAAIEALNSGAQGGANFEIWASVTPNQLPTTYLPITFEYDRSGRRARVVIAGQIEGAIEPIKNPVTGEEHTIRLGLPNGFEYKEADIANAVAWTATLGERTLAHQQTYAELWDIDWSNS